MSETNNDNIPGIISEMARLMPRSILDHLALSIRDLNSSEERDSLVFEVGVPESRKLVERLNSVWSESQEITPAALSIAMQTAAELAQRVDSESELELVWTGPRPGIEAIRRINVALLELVESAEHQLLIVTFVAHPYPRLSQALKEAVGRGVEVTLVIESSVADGGRLERDPAAVFASSVPDAIVYRWPIESRPAVRYGNPPTLHAKCAVADERVALFSSANFTERAMETNMEIGVLVRGTHIPEQTISHFDNLITRGTLTKSE